MVFLMKIVAIITVLFLEIPCFEAVNAVKVAAFNVQVFGQTKISKKYVREILAKVCKAEYTNSFTMPTVHDF